MRSINNHKSKDNIQFLLEYCSKMPELYNEVSNHLYERFGIIGAEICLLVTYYVNEERRRNEIDHGAAGSSEE